MNILHLRHFYEVVRFGSFVGAAKEVKASQPTLSRSVKLLEKDLGLVLMIRNKEGITLTERGKTLFTDAKDLFDRLDELERRARQMDPKRALRLAASENLCIHVLPSFVRQGLDAGLFAAVDLFSGTAEQIEERVSNALADIGLFYNQPRNPRLKHRIVGEVEFKLVFPRNKSRQDLDSLPFVGSRASDYSQPYFALRALQKHKIHPSRIIESNSQEAQLQLALQGVGYTVVPSFLVKNHAAGLNIDRHFTESAKVHCVYRHAPLESGWSLLQSHLTKLGPKL